MVRLGNPLVLVKTAFGQSTFLLNAPERHRWPFVSGKIRCTSLVRIINADADVIHALRDLSLVLSFQFPVTDSINPSCVLT